MKNNENKKSKVNLILNIIATILLVLGIVLIIIKGISGEYIDEDGILYEKFYLIVLGFLSIFISIIMYITAFVKKIMDIKKKK